MLNVFLIFSLYFCDVELDQILVQWDGAKIEREYEKNIQHLFEEQVERTPDARAIIYQGESISYRELNRQANLLAHYLRAKGVEPEVRVALMIERGIEMVVAIMGVLKAGGAYVPLDSNYPV